jgi:signal transduction histidine kinase
VPFEQAANTRVTKEGGTGLGLPISKALVEAHGGRLELSSREGEGTTVRIRLPANGGAGGKFLTCLRVPQNRRPRCLLDNSQM